MDVLEAFGRKSHGLYIRFNTIEQMD